MKHQLQQTSVLCLASFVLSLSAHAAFTRLATETYPGGGGGPTGGVTKAYVDAQDLATLFASTNYTDDATNALDLAHLAALAATNTALRSALAASAASSTNYTDTATNATVAYADATFLGKNDKAVGAIQLEDTDTSKWISADGESNWLIHDADHTTASPIAAMSDLNAYLPLAGGTMTGPIQATSITFENGSSEGSIDILSMGLRMSCFKTCFVNDNNDISEVIPDNSKVLTAKKAETDYPAITNAYAYTDTATNNLSAVLMAALCATNDLLKIYADRMGSADWNATTAYVKGNFVWYTDETTPENTGLYVASGPGTNLPPPLNPDKWKKMDNANAIFSQDNAQLSKNFLPWKGGSNAYVEWQGQNVRVYNGGLFARTLDLQAGFSNLKAYEGTSPYTSLPDYLRGATWNTAADPFAKKSDLDAYLPLDGSKEMDENSNIRFYGGPDNWFTIGAQSIGSPYVYGVFSGGQLWFGSDNGDGGGESRLITDGTPVLTAKKAETDYPAITNSYPFALGNMVSNTVSQWEGYWTGSNVYWEVTNYLDSADAKIMRLMEIQTNGVVREVWNDTDKYSIFFTNTLEKVENTNAYTRGWVGEFVTNSLADKADRAWGNHTSAGADAPTNMVWHTAPTTVFAGGFEFSKVAIAGGEIGVLVSKGCVPYAAGAEGKFIIGDGFGTNYFGFVKKDDYIIATRVDGIEVDQATKMVTLTYDLVFSGEYPIVYYSPSVIPITAQTWIQLNKADGTLTPGAPWPVTFSAGAGYIKAHISFASSTPEMPPEGFFTSSTAVIGGGTFKTNMKADFLDAGIMCTNTDTKVMGVIRPTFDGTTVHWNWSKQ